MEAASYFRKHKAWIKFKDVRVMKNTTKSLGQYMTPWPIAEFMVSLISKPKSARILEPGAGTGVFLRVLKANGFNNITAYEIDRKFRLDDIGVKVIYKNFLEVKPIEEFDVIIGNPPYVRWRNIPIEWREKFKRTEYWRRVINGLCDLTYAFIYHSVNLLKSDGELIFICPLFWLETLHGRNLRKHLAKRGYLDLVINLNEARIFKEVSSTIVIFKYIKGKKASRTKVIEYESKKPVDKNILSRIKQLIQKLDSGHYVKEQVIRDGPLKAYFSSVALSDEPWKPIPPDKPMALLIEQLNTISKLGEIAEIGNGMVSGLDEAFKLTYEDFSRLNEQERRALIYVYKARTLGKFFPTAPPVPYIFVNHVTKESVLRKVYPYFYRKLVKYKERLISRYNYNTYIPWWHWVFLRNKHLFESYKLKIFVPSKERYDSKKCFRFTLIKDDPQKTYYATQDVSVICIKSQKLEDILYTLGILNSKPFEEWILVKGFSRGGVYDFSEEPLKRIPIPLVDSDSQQEHELRRLIINVTKEIISSKSTKKLSELNSYVEKLIELKTQKSRTRLDYYINLKGQYT